MTVADELTKRATWPNRRTAYLHTLIASVPTAANAGYYAQIVPERAVLRRLVEAGTKIVQLGYASGGGDVDDLVNVAQAEVYAVTERGAKTTRLAEILEPTLDEIEARPQAGELVGVPRAHRPRPVTNGLHPGQMIVVAARPALGKSTLPRVRPAGRIAHTRPRSGDLLARNEPIEIIMRLLSAEAGVHFTHAVGPMCEEDWTKLARTMGASVRRRSSSTTRPSMTLMEIRAKGRRLEQRHDLKLIVIDYLQLMTLGKRTESRQQEVAELSRALKLLAKELECPVIAVTQLNRGPEQRTDKSPEMCDLRESGCLTA